MRMRLVKQYEISHAQNNTTNYTNFNIFFLLPSR